MRGTGPTTPMSSARRFIVLNPVCVPRASAVGVARVIGVRLYVLM